MKQAYLKYKSYALTKALTWT